ncbi:MAG TPA: hypothetical protein VFV87_20760 [Pirellulaceae bacterium]|nr:hypothetical protein [Pirellulaceae bacterium]
MSAVIFLSSDMLFSSRVLGAGQALGVKCQVVSTSGQIAAAVDENCRLVLIDLGMASLDLTAAVAAIRASAPTAKIVAFGPHVDEALLESGRAAGCDLVLPRSQFHKQYVDLLRVAAGPGDSPRQA